MAYIKHMPLDCEHPSSLTPVCGNALRKWQRVPQEEIPVAICCKAERDEGGRWCGSCIKALRAKLVSQDGGDPEGRATHIWLCPWSEGVINSSEKPEEVRDSVMALVTHDDKEYTDPSYKCCNECRQPWHLVQEENHITDWNRSGW